MATFAQLAGVLVQAVKDLKSFAEGELHLPDKEIEQKLEVVSNVMALGFSMPVNMSLSMHQILVQLLLGGAEKSHVDFIAKDFLITKILDLSTKVLSELRKNNVRLENEVLQDSMLEQTRWTVYVIKDREVQKKMSPDLSLRCVENLALNFRAFSPLSQTFVSSCLPGISGIASSTISGDIKQTTKVKIAMTELW